MKSDSFFTFSSNDELRGPRGNTIFHDFMEILTHPNKFLKLERFEEEAIAMVEVEERARELGLESQPQVGNPSYSQK